MIAKLNSDVLSCFHGRQEIPDKKARGGVRIENGQKIYGVKNEEVELVADHGNVWIVENKKGIRYPVNVSKLNIQQ